MLSVAAFPTGHATVLVFYPGGAMRQIAVPHLSVGLREIVGFDFFFWGDLRRVFACVESSGQPVF
jgi:hypothetical protein